MTAPVARFVRVTGQVQGVGFRPFVQRLAMRHHLAGWVRNAASDVQIEVEGEAGALDRFLAELVSEAPPLAAIDALDVATAETEGRAEFQIVPSHLGHGPLLAPAPDAAICPACERELFDPANRRYRYPFITCSDCGPRYTIIRSMPYDRGRTSMVDFSQCPACLAEYQSLDDRRHHSESNSCPVCGPVLWYADPLGRPPGPGQDPIAQAAEAIRNGGIVAVRGLGGFQLAVDATNGEAVTQLRRRKHRESKPLALMVRTLDQARGLAVISDAEAAALVSPARPIVLLERLSSAGFAEEVAPGLTAIGIMLATTPAHHLLLEQVERPLVMTSGNRSDEPIALGNAEAIDRLGGIADGFLLHNREIVARYDDSVLRLVNDRPVLLRRARGYAPRPLRLPVASPEPLVAVGAHLKSTFTLVDDRRAVVSQHLGDLENLETLRHFQATLAGYRDLFGVEPTVAVHDLHPGYLSTRVAQDLGLSRTVAVQHHHAHVAAVLAEHGELGPAIGVAYDGTGYGDDGNTWGGELLVAELTGYRRLGHLGYVRLPGGDLAATTPWRSALGYAESANLTEAWQRVFVGLDPSEVLVARRQIERGLNAPWTSSMGRLFDAAAAIVGLRMVSRYEGQAAMELEALAGRRPGAEISAGLFEQQGIWILDPTPILAALASRRERGADPADLAADFHASVARMTERIVHRAAEVTGLRVVALGGGVFQNGRLLSSLQSRLTSAKLRVLVPRTLSPNDGAISFGQAAVAAARLAAGG